MEYLSFCRDMEYLSLVLGGSREFFICCIKPGSWCLSVGSSGQLGRDEIPDNTEARQEDDAVLHLPVDSVLDPPGRPTGGRLPVGRSSLGEDLLL